MALTRREFVQLLGLTGAGLWLVGCESTGKPVATDYPGANWPGLIDRPDKHGSNLRGKSDRATGGSAGPGNPSGTVAGGNSGGSAGISGGSGGYKVANITGPIHAIPRSRWTNAAPIQARILPMGTIDRITVHHEGWTPVYYADAASVATRLEQIRRTHLDRLGAGDIGYHFIIDRAGRVWQGRDLAYQGAHVRDHNPHNIGIMCLGNFDMQTPTDAQLATLKPMLVTLMQTYKVPLKRVYTHQELNPTECPGTNLQSRMVTLRRNGLA